MSLPAPPGDLEASEQQRISRALDYPYGRPDRSYIYHQGRALPWSARNLGLCRSHKLTPVLAVGSNGSPEQLTRKYGHDDSVAIPVSVGILHDHDVVYAGYMTGYGAIPATLIASSGCSVRIAVTWLDDIALARMHATEAVGIRTCFGRVTRLRCDGMLLGQPDPQCAGGKGSARADAWTYQSLAGGFGVDGSPVAVAELSAASRSLQAYSQAALQRRLRRWMEPERLRQGRAVEPDFREWVNQNTCCEARRNRINCWLHERRIDLPLADFHAESVGVGSE